MAFELLTGSKFYLEEETVVAQGYWEGAIFHPETTEKSYSEKVGHVEPLEREESELLPEGITSKHAIWLYTDEDLNTYKDFETEVTDADVIYLSDPREGRKKPQRYVVFDREDWGVDASFELLQDSHNYICIREGKL